MRKALEGSLGGTAVVAMGTLGRQEALGGISDNYDEVARQGDYIANAITRALTHAKPLTSARVAGATTYIAVPATNPALLALLYDNLAGFSCNDTLGACTIDRSVLPPYLAGDAVGTWVTALRIGDHAWVSEPGEAFPEVSTALRDAFPDAAGVHIVGMGQDQLGYYYPPEDYPASELNPSDFILFNVSGALADESVDAAALDARELGFAGTPGHPMMDDEDPQAFFHAGTQFFPSLDEAASPTREFLVEGKTSEAPVLPGSPDHSVSAIGVSFGDGTSAVAHGETRLTHTFPKPGTYTVTTRVTDEGGTERTYSHPIVVDPALDAGVDTTRRHGEDILRATLTGGDGHVIAAHWSFSDGTHADGLTVTRPRAHVGSRGTVTVVDGAGDTATASF